MTKHGKVKVYYSVGWKKPYCYTILDNLEDSNPSSMIDGGFFHYRVKDHEKYIENLTKTNVNFITGFDGCKREKAKQYIKYLLKKEINIYPIIKKPEELNEISFDVKGIATRNPEVAKQNKDYKTHYFGLPLDDEIYNIVDSIDINPYQNNKYYLLEGIYKSKNYPINLPKEILKLGEFYLYGSSLFVNKPNDYDLLYYGDKTEKEIKEQVDERINLVKLTDDFIKGPRVTHLWFAVDNGIPLNDCKTIRSLYDKTMKTVNKHNLIPNKSWLAFSYLKDYDFVKEAKTLLISNYYIEPNELYKHIYKNLHLFYKLMEGDKKAEMLFNRKLYQKFNRVFQLPEDRQRNRLYEKGKIQEAFNKFFKEEEFYSDEEQIKVKL